MELPKPIFCGQAIDTLVKKSPKQALTIMHKVRSGRDLQPPRPNIIRREVMTVVRPVKNGIKTYTIDVVCCDVHRSGRENTYTLGQLLWSQPTNSIECRQSQMNKLSLLQLMQDCFEQCPDIWQ